MLSDECRADLFCLRADLVSARARFDRLAIELREARPEMATAFRLGVGDCERNLRYLDRLLGGQVIVDA